MIFRQATAALLRRIRFRTQTVSAASRQSSNGLSTLLCKRKAFSCPHHEDCNFRWQQGDIRQHSNVLWIVITGQAALFFGIGSCPVLAEDVARVNSSEDSGANVTGLQRIEDGSVVSNEHTSKWRIFTDNGMEFFMQGKLDEAQKLFLLAVEEAKEGFGECDPHVASACNNLAELYRVRKVYDKAEPLYLQAIKILEESFGTDDVRVGAALHNLGKFYLMQRKLEEARVCYERALKIKGRVLGHGHPDYADTMYHLGTVLYLQGNEKDAEALISDSIRILEEVGLGESYICITRLRYLAQIMLKSDRLEEAENVQRKILHIMELTKGWNSLDTVTAAESLAMTLQSVGKLRDAHDLLERCLDCRRSLLPQDHIQIAANKLSLARLAMLNFNRLRKPGTSAAVADLDKAKDLLKDTIRISQHVLDGLIKQKHNIRSYEPCEDNKRDGKTALVILLQSLHALGRLEITKQEFQESKEVSPALEAESSLRQCISAYKEYGNGRLVPASAMETNREYLSCLKQLLSLMTDKRGQSGGTSMGDLKDEITRVETVVSTGRKQRSHASH
ncbi:hypothetical protein Nepgr_021247 [Nepenthes gracilis]|uniref:Kinesin light chain n=1 Tax=Nepenthes gracilis TaxID=150966 RepID=A0AAD3SYQ8_NEPGR|nr:hypothetical protein Nepgr_021247 [Nepenthes gracilis]